MKKFINVLLLAVIIIGHGMAPNTMHGTQAMLMAKRAAIVDCQRQAANQGVTHIMITQESYIDGIYTVVTEGHN